MQLACTAVSVLVSDISNQRMFFANVRQLIADAGLVSLLIVF